MSVGVAVGTGVAVGVWVGVKVAVAVGVGVGTATCTVAITASTVPSPATSSMVTVYSPASGSSTLADQIPSTETVGVMMAVPLTATCTCCPGEAVPSKTR